MSLWSSIGAIAGSFIPGVGTALGATIGGVLDSATASKKAAGAQQNAANAANALQGRMYDETVARNKPFVEGGTKGFNALLDRLGLSDNNRAEGFGSFGRVPTAEDVMATPGYQFGLDQGQNALQRQLNARGHSYSPQAAQRLLEYNQNYATGQYGNAFNRLLGAQQQQYNQLYGVAGLGQSAANNTASAGQQYANQFGQNTFAGADAQSNSILDRNTLLNKAVNQGVSAYRNRNADRGFGMGPNGPYLGQVQWQN